MAKVRRDTKGRVLQKGETFADIRFSDVYLFYKSLMDEAKLSIKTVNSVNCILAPTFQLAVRDQIIRNNPTDQVMSELRKKSEELNAARAHREPVLIPEFSCHVTRHTFCTRLCENETNIKVIQSVMGHKNV